MFAAIMLAWTIAASLAGAGPEMKLAAADRAVSIPRAPRPPRIEDFVNGPDFPAYTRVAGFTQREPADGEPASRETIAFLAYDSANLYVIFDCRAPRGNTRAHLSKRDDIDSDDGVMVILDTFRDRRRAYQFRVNPLGVQADAIVADGQSADATFDTVWYSDGRLTPNGYVARLAIPFRSLRFPRADAQTWGIALARAIPSNSETSYWPAVTVRMQGLLGQLGEARGLERVSAGRNVQIVPYGTAVGSDSLDGARAGDAALVRTGNVRAGVDTKIVLRDSLTLDTTVNPDFSQVETDEPQPTVNQRFEVFFPEKRPFFLENANYFQTPENLFFSRRVVDPRLGGRLTGKSGGWLIGVLGIDDRAPGAALQAAADGAGSRAAIGVARVQREIGEQSSVGFLATSRDFASGFNRVAAVDARVRLNANWIASGQATVTQTRRAGETASAFGSGYKGRIQHDGAHVYYDATLVDRSPAFRADLAYIPQVDIRDAQQMLAISSRPGRRGINLLQGWVWADGNWNRKGAVQTAAAQVGFYAELARRTYLNLYLTEQSELFNGVTLHTDGPGVYAASDLFDWLGFKFQIRTGMRPNYSPAAGLAPFTASATNVDAGLTLRPAPRIRAEETYIYRALDTRAGFAFAPAGTPVFRSHIARTKLNYQFSRALSARLIVDYNGVTPNASLVALDRGARVTADLLATWLLYPGTAVYVGYTNRSEEMWSAGREQDRGGSSPRMATVGRQFFVKISYLFRP